MLRIRDEQIAVFRRRALQDFRARLARHLADVVQQTGALLPPGTISEQVDRAMARSAEFGFRRECDVARYAVIVCCHLGGFTEEPHPKEALNILFAYGVDPQVKLDRLQQWAGASDQARAIGAHYVAKSHC